MMSRRPRNPWRGAFDLLEIRGLLSLVLTPVDVTATQQVPFDAVVAKLVDTNFNASPSDFNTPPGSVQINWGDGSTGSGLVVGPVFPGVFYIDASHTYTTAGSYSTQIAVNDQSGDNAIAIGSATVTTQGPQLTIAASTIKGSAGTALTGVAVATFLDPNPADTSPNFQALITWGNGNTSIGLIQGGNGAFTVYGTNTYGAQGTYDTTVTVISTNNGLDGYASGTAKIGPTSTYGLTGQQFAANAGAPFNATVATFTDATLSDTANDFNTTIDWGDGSPATVGTVIMTGTSMVGGATVNDFSISGSHVYATPGTESITVTLNDQHNSTSYTMSTVIVSGPVLTTLPTTFNPSLNQPFTGIVGSFFDTNTSDSTASTLTATITWGDGHITQGTIVPVVGVLELFEVTGTNTYTASGKYAVSIAIANTDNQSTTIASTAVVASSITAISSSFTATLGQPVGQPPNGVLVATFVDSNPNATNSTAVINWGDGESTPGVVTGPNASGAYSVMGNHTYSTASATSTYSVTVMITDPSGQSAKATSTATVAAPTISATGTTFSTSQATSGVTVANFTDSNTNANVSNITAVIKWGDGEISLGTVQSTGRPYVYTVMGNHSYTILNSSGSYAVTVTIADPSGQTATVTSTALVVTPVLNPIPLTVNFTAGILPSSPVTVGSFFDTTAGATASNFTATIMWGPGQQTTPGTVTASSTTPGLFLVSGTYLYSVADTYALDIQVQDKEGNSTKIASSAVVTAAAYIEPADNCYPHGRSGNWSSYGGIVLRFQYERRSERLHGDDQLGGRSAGYARNRNHLFDAWSFPGLGKLSLPHARKVCPIDHS